MSLVEFETSWSYEDAAEAHIALDECAAAEKRAEAEARAAAQRGAPRRGR